MRERQSHVLPQSGSYRRSYPALTWLRERLLPPGTNVMMIAAYAMILAALIMFIVAPPILPPWRFYATIITLSALLVLNVALDDLERSLGSLKADTLYLSLAAVLVLLINWLGQPSSISLLPFLIFMLASQAIVTLPARYALFYTLLVVLSWMGLLWLDEPSLLHVLGSAVSLVPGLIFVMIFSVVVVRFAEQNARTEELLRELQSAHAELAAAREREKDLAVAEERVRLAREIHDGLGHHLTVLNVQLQAAAKLIERDPQRAAATLTTSREVAQSALDEVRQSVAAMRRTPLDGRAIDEALRSLVEEFDRHSSLSAGFEQYGTPLLLLPAASMTIYRAAQEGLTNAQKHASAEHVAVRLDWTSELVRLSVQDDGSQLAASAGSGFGLAGLRERAEQLGGTFSAGAQPDGGFTLELALPLERNSDDSGAARR